MPETTFNPKTEVFKLAAFIVGCPAIALGIAWLAGWM